MSDIVPTITRVCPPRLLKLRREVVPGNPFDVEATEQAEQLLAKGSGS